MSPQESPYRVSAVGSGRLGAQPGSEGGRVQDDRHPVMEPGRHLGPMNDDPALEIDNEHFCSDSRRLAWRMDVRADCPDASRVGARGDRQSVVEGKSGSGGVDLGGGRYIKKK